MTRILVAGGDRVDAGKTTFAVGLLDWLPSDASAFKPRAGNDFWFDHDDALTALADGRLYGKDVARLVASAGNDATPESRNPIHRLWRPTPDRTGMLGETGRTFLVDRVTTPDATRFVVNGNVELPEHVRESLPLADATRVESVAEFNDVMAEAHLAALDATRAAVRDAERAVVESYADIADPLRDVSYDAVAVVEPSRCRVFDGDRWEIARETASGSTERGQLEERVGTVAGMIDPVETLSLDPLADEDRTEPSRIAERYADTYEVVSAVAEKSVNSGRA